MRLPCGGTSGSGPFHSQSMEALYAHYPGLIVMTPATVEDAYSMLLEAVVSLNYQLTNLAGMSFRLAFQDEKTSPRLEIRQGDRQVAQGRFNFG